MLEDLERRNLFVVALDDRREWFRFHHLFAEVLQKQSAAKDPGAAQEAHRRASMWYESHGSIGDAIRHTLAAEDLERAAGLLERAWPEKDRSYESARWLARVKTLPDQIVRTRPVLSMGYAWALLNSGELEAAEPRLQDVERWLEAIENGNGGSAHAIAMVVDDDQRLAALRLELDSARVYLAQSLGDAATLERARRALDLVPAGDHAGRATGTALVALALWGCGDLEAAHRTFSEALAAMHAAGHELDAIRGIFVLGDIRVAQGRLREAVGIYEQGLQVAKKWTQSQPETDELYLGLSEVHREWNDVERAAGYLEAVAQAAQRAAHNGNRLRWCTSMAKIREARGELDAAIELLDEAESHQRRDPLPRLRPIPAMKARVHLAHGRIEHAIEWAKQAKRSIDDLSYLREFEHITLARILIAQSRNDDVTLGLLERLRLAAQTGGRMGSVIEILVLQSIAQQALGNTRRALDSLGEALALAEPEGYLRVFLDEGTRMRDLLRHAVARGLGGESARRMLLAFEAPRPKPLLSAPPATEGPAGQSLTTRELEILRLIDAGLRNQEIADHLSISTATVKRHIANAYGKLGAGHRTEALARAKEMKLL
jgi:LuxR family maltose regulon positive regulatory protein